MEDDYIDGQRNYEFRINDEYEKLLPENWKSMNVNEDFKKLKKVPRPDYAKQKALNNQLKAQIDHVVTRIKTVDDQIASSISGSNNNKKNVRFDLIQQLKQKKEEISKVSTERRELVKQKDELDKVFQMNKDKGKSLKNEIKYKTVEEIDEALYELDYKYNTESLTPNEQKSILKEIQTLKQSKNNVSQFSKIENDLKSSTQSFEELKTNIKTLGNRIGEISGEIEQIQKQLDAQDKIKVVDKTEGLREEKQKLYEEKNNTIAERKKKIEEFNELIKDYEEYQYQSQKLNYIKRKQDHDKQLEVKEKKAKEEEEKKKTLNPYLKEINTISRLISYLETLLPKTNNDNSKNKIIPSEIKLTNGAVQTKLVKEVDNYGGFKPGKKNKKNNNNNNNTNTTAPPTTIPEAPTTTENKELPIDNTNTNTNTNNNNNQQQQQNNKNNKNKNKKNKNQLINLSLTTLSDFDLLKIKPPIQIEEISNCIELLNEKKKTLRNISTIK